MNDRELRGAVRRAAAISDDVVARQRAWRVVQAAYREYEPRRRTRRWARVAAVAALFTVVAGGAGAAATMPRSHVGRLVRDALGVAGTHTRPVLVRVPGGGRLLVQSGRSTWLVAGDGARRRLGSYDGASWSPHGMFIAAWRDGTLTAIEPSGRPHWSLSRPGTIRAARWSQVDGFRVAYLNAGWLRVVNGDGTADRRYGQARATVAPAWRPDVTHVLAYVDARSRVQVVAVDAHRQLWRSAPIAAPITLAWSANGDRLLVVTRQRIFVYDRAGRSIAERPVAGVRAAAWSPRAPVVAVVRFDAATETSELVLLDTAHALRERPLLRGPGRFGAPAWAPDGNSLLLPWPDAGQWLFFRQGRSRGPTAIANIARQFAPGATHPPFPRAVQRCCSSTEP